MAADKPKRFHLPDHWTLKECLAYFSKPDPSGCRLWTGPLDDDGYGRRWIKGRKIRSNRLAWEVHRGPIPPGKQVLHKCDVRPCVEETHLFLGTNAKNMADRDAKGRQAKGERGGMAKLTEAEVLAIRAMPGKHRDIAAKFGVTHPLVGAIKRGRIWRHV